MSGGADKARQLLEAGFTQDEVRDWSAQQRAQLTSAGFNEAEVNDWFGEREPNMTPFREQFRKNLMAAGATDEAASAAGTMAEKGWEQALEVGQAAVQPQFTPAQRAMIDRGSTVTKIVGSKPARTFDDAIDAGFQMSVSGLLARGKEPTKVLTEDAPAASRIAANIATTIGDLPFMGLGAFGGGAGGAPGGPLAVPTAMAGAFALPAGLRATLMDSYRNGEFKSFGDFWDRASGIIWDEAKGWMTGFATGGAGEIGRVAVGASPYVMTKLAAAPVRAIAPTAAEIATMVTVGKALEGQVPSAQDFTDAAVILAGGKIAVRATRAIETKLQDVYAKTGTPPRDLLDLAAKDPTVVQDLVAENPRPEATVAAGTEQSIPRAAPDYLNPAERGAETRFAERLSGDFAGAVDEYAKIPETEGGKIINTDLARELSADYGRSKESRSALAAAVHEPASWFAKQLYERALTAPPQTGRVLFTAGGTGAGKSTGLAMTGLDEQADVIYDTNMNRADSAITKIDQALASGRSVSVLWTYRDAVEAFANGTLPRAERMGRTVRLESHMDTHAGMGTAMRALLEHYKDDPRVQFLGVDNSLGRGNAQVVPIEDLLKKGYNSRENDYVQAARQAHAEGRISDHVYRATLGEEPPHLPGARAEDRGQPEQAGGRAGDEAEGVAPQHQVSGREIVEAPIAKLKLSGDVPQFKSGSNDEGIVEPLGGKFDRRGVAPIQVWEREDGALEVISGRHRLDLARRSGEKTIPAQIYKEADGFTRAHAIALDHELNIRDNQGKVQDYVAYFKNTGITREEADSRGLLARNLGKRGFAIADQGSGDLIAAHRAGQLSDEAAYEIAQAAPKDARLQAVGMKAVQDGKTIGTAVNLIGAVKTLAAERTGGNLDMFGFDDSAMREAEKMATIATSKQRAARTRLAAISGAAKRPELAASEGVKVRNPKAAQERVAELRAEVEKWDRWPTSPELVAEIRADAGMKDLSPEALEEVVGGSAPAPSSNAPALFPQAPARPAASPTPNPQQQAVLDRISVGEGQKRAYTLDKFYTDTKDDLFPIRRLVDAIREDATLAASKDPYKLARLTRGVSGKAQQFLEISPFRFDTYVNVGKAFTKIIEPVKNDLDGLRSYLVAKRALELDRRGIETGVPLDAARDVVREGAKYDEVQKDLVDYQDHLVRYLVDAGVLTKDAATAMREANRDYVPFFRLMDEGAGAKGAGPGLSVRSPVKSIKGSERRIVDPLESIVKNTYLFTTLAERNAVGLSLVELAEKAGREDLVKKVAAPAKPVTVQAEELQRFLDAHGIEGEGDAFTIFRRGYVQPAEDEIVVYRDGKRELYQVPREVAATFKGLDRESAGLLTRILSIPAKTLRAGATLAPDFMGRNFNRDQIQAFVTSENGYVPVFDFMRGMFAIAKKDGDFQMWLKSGGANATLISMDRRYLQAKLDEIAELQSVGQKAWNVVKTPVELLRIASELVENATRVGEFMRAGGGAGKEAAQEAGFASREVTLDFARMGAKTRAVNMITAFWNAQVEGVDRVARAFKDRPLATSAKVAASITLPSVLLWFANKDDPRWREIPDWERDLFWIVMTKDHIYRIPKPFELGVVFGSIPERLLDGFAADKPDAFQGLASSVWKAFTPGVIPTFAAPILEQMTNHSFFTDRPLVPDNLEKLLPEYQYSPYTTEATKALGHLIGAVPGGHDKSIASPIVVDNYIRGWSGTLGVYAIQVADAALRKTGVLPDPVKPAWTLADMPVIKAFVVRYPSAQAQSIADFNEHYKASKMVIDTITYLAKQGEPEAAMREANMDPIKLVRLDTIHEALANAHRVIQLVEKNPGFSADEKRQLIDTTYTQMIDMAREGESMLREVTKELGPKFGKDVAKGAAAAVAAVH